jgi:hypothetical protein
MLKLEEYPVALSPIPPAILAHTDRQILAVRPVPHFPGQFLVLAFFPAGDTFVTWQYGQERDCFSWGHYYQDNYADALADFLGR